MKIMTVLLILFGLAGCSEPLVKLEVKEIAGDLVLHFDNDQTVNGLLGCLVWAEGANQLLWDARLDYFSGKSFKYGDQTQGFRQIFPANGMPSAPPKDLKIYVLIEFQYDSSVSANGGSTLYAFVHKSNGVIENLGEQQWVKPPK